MRAALLTVGSLIALGVVWLMLGRRVVLLLDAIFPGPASPNEAGITGVDPDIIFIDQRRYELPGRSALSRSNRVVYRNFTFGPAVAWRAGDGYQFAPDPGDTVTFTRDVSRLEWHTPFAIAFIGPKPAKRHRFAYDRLHWKKKSGATFNAVWRQDQQFKGEWFDQYNDSLVRLEINLSPSEQAAAAYLANKGWKPDEYRLESNAEGSIDAIYLADGATPGAGKSLSLSVDPHTNKIRESGFQ
jgi:hypothetical protein